MRYFRAIVACGSLSAAARKLNVAQPALSLHITKLEQFYGIRLLERSARGVTPTEAGSLLVRHSEIILEELEQAERALRAFSVKSARKNISVAILLTLADSVASPLINAIDRAFPSVKTLIRSLNSGACHRAVSDGDVDVAITLDDPVFPPGVQLTRQPLLYIGPSDGTDKANAALTFEEVAYRPLLLPPMGNRLRTLIDHTANQMHLRVHVAAEIDGVSARKEAVISGLGGTILPYSAVSRECSEGLLSARPIVSPCLDRAIELRWRDMLEPTLVDWMIKTTGELLGEGTATIAPLADRPAFSG
jgi:LysR family nitrogen assimilation transcriptional regulator